MSVDPTQALEDIRAIVSDVQQSHGDQMKAEELAEKVSGLDDWMSRGGFPPDQWTPRIGRPRRVGDGPVVLKDVEHGTRKGYNKGCRCEDCTAANREAAARRRHRIKEHS